MPNSDEPMGSLPRGWETAALTDVKLVKALYVQAEATLLEAMKHSDAHFRDGFDALVMLGTLALSIHAVAIRDREVRRADNADEGLTKVVQMILTIADAIAHRQIKVSQDAPCSADEMIEAANLHLEAGAAAFSQAVADAQRHVATFATDALRYLALDHDKKAAAEAELLRVPSPASPTES